MFIPDPGYKHSNKREGWKKNVLSYLFCSHTYHKINNNLIFELAKKIIWVNLQRIKKLFTHKIVIKLSKIYVWYPGSRKNLFRIPDLDSQYWSQLSTSRDIFTINWPASVPDPQRFITDPDSQIRTSVYGAGFYYIFSGFKMSAKNKYVFCLLLSVGTVHISLQRQIVIKKLLNCRNQGLS